MKKLLLILSLLILSGCQPAKQATLTSATTTTFKPTFEADYNNCGNMPVTSVNSVTFGSGSDCNAGRVVSVKGYKNITQIRATVDLSKLTSNFVVSTFYMVSNPTNPGLQPKGTNYCDAGGTHNEWNCQEIDFFEANKNVVLQHTMHLGDGGSTAPQRFEFSYTSSTDVCYPNLVDSPGTGLHKWNGLDVSKPVQMVVDFTTTAMKITFTQSSVSVVVYDSSVGTGYSGSGTIDTSKLASSMANGYWLSLSMWQWDSSKQSGTPWAPGTTQGFYNWANPPCGWGTLCSKAGSYFGVTNIEVDASGEI